MNEPIITSQDVLRARDAEIEALEERTRALDAALNELLSAPAPLDMDSGHTVNAAGTAAVSTTQYWEDMATCPRGVKVQLLGEGGVAVYGLYDGKNTFWEAWAPMPRRRQE